MAPKRPYVQDGLLHGVTASGEPIPVGTDAWYQWLEDVSNFSFHGAAGAFTAHRERRGAGRAYWKAYRRQGGVLRRGYLGRSEELSLVRLDAVATELAAPPPVAVAPPTPGLLGTKLSPPPARPRLLERLRLLDRLDAGRDSRLTLIAAPAGSGKTTLLSQWLHERIGLRVAWVSLDSADNAPLRFWQYLVAALATIAPEAAEHAHRLLRMELPPDSEQLTEALLAGLSTLSENLVLVLDDYHTITEPTVHQAITALLDRLSPRAHLVIASRSEPPLPLSRLRAAGQLHELRVDDLRFSAAEGARFFAEAMQIPLAEEEAATLVARTEGWAAGLQLAALATRGRADARELLGAFTGDHRFVVDYFTSEILANHPPHVQAFLLQTAILDRLCAQLCDAVLGVGEEKRRPGEAGGYSQLLLESLERANLFLVPLDASRRWYRYHQLFADVLRQRLREGASAGAVAGLHRRASVWYERAGLLEESVAHAFAAGADDQTAGLIERASPVLLSGGMERHHTLSAWLAALPEGTVAARPRLCLTWAWLAARTDLLVAERWLSRAEAAHQGTTLDAGGQNTQGEIATLRAVLAVSSGAATDAIRYGRSALHDLDAANLFMRGTVAIALGRAYLSQGLLVEAADSLAEAGALGRAAGNIDMALQPASNLAYVQRARGLLQPAVETCHQALIWSEAHGYSTAADVSWAHAALADLLRERHELDAALKHAQEAVERSTRARQTNTIAQSLLVLARVRQARGELAGALEAFAALRRAAERFQVLPLGALLGAFEAQLWLAQGNLAGAWAWAERQLGGAALAPYAISPILLVYAHEHLAVAPSQVLLAHAIHAGDRRALRSAADLLAAQQAAPETARFPWLTVKRRLLLALAHHALDESPQAQRWLRAALEAAEFASPGGYTQVFLDEGPPLATLLVAALPTLNDAPRLQSRARRLLALRSAGVLSGTPTEDGQAGLVEPLTERERAILRLLADGFAQPAIAQRLVVSPNTIKTHIRNLYGKLGVHTRAEALAAARALGILS